MTTTTVSETDYTDSNGVKQTQYKTTVPKQLAEAFDLGGARVEWKVQSSNALVIQKVEE